MLAGVMPDQITILDHDVFFYPMWTDINRILLAEDSAKWLEHLSSSYVFHLWNNYNEAELININEHFIGESKSAYASYVRAIIN